MASEGSKRYLYTGTVTLTTGHLEHVAVVSVHHGCIKSRTVSEGIDTSPHRRVMVPVAREQHVLRHGRDLCVGVVRDIDALEGFDRGI